MDKSFGQIGCTVNRNGDGPVPIADHNMMATGDAIKRPSMFFQNLFELFAGHIINLYSIYDVCQVLSKMVELTSVDLGLCHKSVLERQN